MQKEPTKKAAGKRNAGANPPRKLSRAEKKQIAEVIQRCQKEASEDRYILSQILHWPQCFVYTLVAGIAHQSHDRKW